MLAPLRRCVDGWPCMVGDSEDAECERGASKTENPQHDSRWRITRAATFTIQPFVCDVNRAAYKCSAEKWVTSPGPTLSRIANASPRPFHHPCTTVRLPFTSAVSTKFCGKRARGQRQH